MAICSGCQGQHIFSHTSHIFHYYLNLQYIQLGMVIGMVIILPVEGVDMPTKIPFISRFLFEIAIFFSFFFFGFLNVSAGYFLGWSLIDPYLIVSFYFFFFFCLHLFILGALTIFLPVCFTGRPQAPLTGGHMTLPENLDGNELTGIYCC